MKNLIFNKKWKLLFASMLIITMTIFISCEKDDDNEPGSTVKKYELRFTCTSDNPYKVEVAGHSDIVSGHSYITYELVKDTYSWKVTQQSGYALYPTVKEGTITLDQDAEIVFP